MRKIKKKNGWEKWKNGRKNDNIILIHTRKFARKTREGEKQTGRQKKKKKILVKKKKINFNGSSPPPPSPPPPQLPNILPLKLDRKNLRVLHKIHKRVEFHDLNRVGDSDYLNPFFFLGGGREISKKKKNTKISKSRKSFSRSNEG